jgi:hypothetical protein
MATRAMNSLPIIGPFKVDTENSIDSGAVDGSGILHLYTYCKQRTDRKAVVSSWKRKKNHVMKIGLPFRLNPSAGLENKMLDPCNST